MLSPDDLKFDAINEPESPFICKFCGRYDDHGYRTGFGCHTWTAKDNRQIFKGNFLLDNLHGDGVYVVKNGSRRAICTGGFYCNDLEGYAEVIYSNGIFEGLFRNGARFGPGVLTYADGSQDVGLWHGHGLVRLSRVVEPAWVPRLARSAAAKTYLLRFRKLVPVNEERRDVAKEVLERLGASEDVLRESDALYNPQVRNGRSLFFNRRLYDEVFFKMEDCYIEVTSEESCCENECNCACSLGEFKREEILEQIRHINREIYGLLETLGYGSADCEANPDEECCQKKIDALMSFRDALTQKTSEAAKQTSRCCFSTTKVLIADLLAWNNEQLFTDMLRHSFLHKNSEKNVSFEISKLLLGERKSFEGPGSYENSCVDFLTKCSEGKVYELSDILRKNDLNPNLCDAKGNTGVFFAAARDRLLVIKALVNCGANLDAVNDEGLTPLNLCLLRYLAVQYTVADWEKAFLPEMVTDEEDDSGSDLEEMENPPSGEIDKSPSMEVNQWKKSILSTEILAQFDHGDYEMMQSLTDFQKSFRKLSIAADVHDFQTCYTNTRSKEQAYLLNTDFVHSKEKLKLQEILDGERHSPGSKKKTKTQINESTPTPVESDELLKSKLEVIRRTMACLLHFRSDPDVGQVPFPALIISVFSKNTELVEELLEHGADPNITTLNENATALHVIASMQPSKKLIEVSEVLLRHKADPNFRSGAEHWSALNGSVLGADVERVVLEEGKTPLHLLCMRFDFLQDKERYFQDLAKVLLQSGAIASETFLGHSPLSLAILRGNIRLVESLLATGKVNPNQRLGRDMGVPLVVLILKRFANILFLDVCKALMDALLNGRANPFAEAFDGGNAIDFLQSIEDAKQEKAKAKQAGEKKKKEKSKSGKKGKISDQVLLQKYLLDQSKELLLRRIQCRTTFLLYEFMDEYVAFDDVLEIISFLRPEEVCSNIELMIQEGKMSLESLRFDTLYRLVHFVANQTVEVEKKAKKSPASPTKPNEFKLAKKVLELIQRMDINEKPHFEGAVHPSIDPDEDKYKVCFHCCRKKGKELYCCPKCEMIYFCSETCNKLSVKSRNRHKCKLVFYNKRKAESCQIASAVVSDKLVEKISMVRNKRSKRIVLEKQEGMSQQKLNKFVEIMKGHIEAMENDGSVVSVTQLAKELAEFYDMKAATSLCLSDVTKKSSSVVVGKFKADYKVLSYLEEGPTTDGNLDTTALSAALGKSTPKKGKREKLKVHYKDRISKASSISGPVTAEQHDRQKLSKANVKVLFKGGGKAKGASESKRLLKKIHHEGTPKRMQEGKQRMKYSWSSSAVVKVSGGKASEWSTVELSSARKRMQKLEAEPKSKAEKKSVRITKPRGRSRKRAEDVVGEEESEKGGLKPSKRGRFANSWFQQFFVRNLTKLFPSDFPKQLLPFACFAGGQLYYKFHRNDPFYCANYSSL